MNKLKQALSNLPEYYLLILVLIYWYSTTYFNPFAIVLSILLGLQLVYKNKILGVFIGLLFILVNIYMIFALVDEQNEFSSFNTKAKQMLFAGLLIFAVNLIVSIMMIRKNSSKEEATPALYPHELGI